MWLVFALGTCGEDSDITGEEFDRLCGPSTRDSLDGSIFQNLALVGAAAAVATVILTGVALRRRRWWPVALLVAALLAAAYLSAAADEL